VNARTLCLIILAAAVLLILFAAGAAWYANRSLKVFYTQDAVSVLAYEAGELYRANPATPIEQIEAMMKQLHEASVIHLRIDATGRAVDPFGTPFRVTHIAQGESTATTVTSAGPDGRFGTSDDITYTSTSVPPPPPAS